MSDAIKQLELLFTRVWREHDLEAALGDLPQDFEWIVPWEFEQAGPDAVLSFVNMRGTGEDDEARRAAGLPSS